MSDLKAIALKAIGLLDLTNLNDDCTEADVEALCRKAQTPHGDTAAICIWKEFVPLAKTQLRGTGIRIATVVNFPEGSTQTDAVAVETDKAIAKGADEIDLVFPYRAFLDGDRETAADQIASIREYCEQPVKLKVILETGKLVATEAIRAASELAIENGADFIKTSTGKVTTNATPEAARIMLEAIRDSGKPVGIKPSGGIRTVEDAANYLALADEIMGDGWASPKTFRFGASGVLDNLLAELGDSDTPVAKDGY